MKKPRKMPVADVFQALLDRFGPQYWWPGDTPTEICIGAILTQNTAWRNVEKAIARLTARRLLDLPALHRLPETELAEFIRPAGCARVKARRLKAFAAAVQSAGRDCLSAFFQKPVPELRAALLAVNGIGPETADCMICYAAEGPVFPVDAYTRRFMQRHYWLEPQADYDQIADLIHRCPALTSARQYGEFHALIVELGKRHCTARAPKCADCPLDPFAHE